MCDMTHSYECHDSFIFAESRVHMRNTTLSYAWPDSFKCATRLILMRNLIERDVKEQGMWLIYNYVIIRCYLRCDSLIRIMLTLSDLESHKEWCDLLLCVVPLIYMHDVTHSDPESQKEGQADWRAPGKGIHIAKNPMYPQKSPNFYKRALYTHKRALFVHKRAHYFLKQTDKLQEKVLL